LGVGDSDIGKDVWDNMGDHNYKEFKVMLPVDGQGLVFYCKCTGGPINVCKVKVHLQEGNGFL